MPTTCATSQCKPCELTTSCRYPVGGMCRIGGSRSTLRYSIAKPAIPQVPPLATAVLLSRLKMLLVMSYCCPSAQGKLMD
jgi:hypothetical protein